MGNEFVKTSFFIRDDNNDTILHSDHNHHEILKILTSVSRFHKDVSFIHNDVKYIVKELCIYKPHESEYGDMEMQLQILVKKVG